MDKTPVDKTPVEKTSAEKAPVKITPVKEEILPEDKLPPIKPEPASKRLEVICRGKPTQIATCIEGLAKAIAKRNQGYAPFFMVDQLDFYKPGSVVQFDPNARKITDIGVYPTDSPSMVGQPRLHDLHVGWIELDGIGQDANGADLCILAFTCQEREWMRFVDTWNVLVDELRRLGVLVKHRASTPNQTPAEGSPKVAPGSPSLKAKGGKPRHSDYDWAFEEIYVKKRRWKTVYEEWRKRIPPHRLNRLTDPEEAFYKAIKYRYDRWEGRNTATLLMG